MALPNGWHGASKGYDARSTTLDNTSTDEDFLRFWERTDNLIRWTDNSPNSESDKLRFEEEVAAKREQAETHWCYHRGDVRSGA
jgi:hypothetical protein